MVMNNDGVVTRFYDVRHLINLPGEGLYVFTRTLNYKVPYGEYTHFYTHEDINRGRAMFKNMMDRYKTAPNIHILNNVSKRLNKNLLIRSEESIYKKIDILNKFHRDLYDWKMVVDLDEESETYLRPKLVIHERRDNLQK